MYRCKSLPTPKELLSELALSCEAQAFIEKSRVSIQNILAKKEDRFLIITGPCSIHDPISAIEYARRLKALSLQVESKILLVMRVHVEKPRTTLGWKGLLHDPFLNGSNDITQGLRVARSLLLELTALEVPASMEFLELMSAHYLADLISWGSIGARTSSSQPHRQIASMLPMPVGFKNATDGNVTVAVQGALSAQFPHTFMNIDENGQIAEMHSQGNPYTHIVLRGGGGRSNFDEQSVAYALNLLKMSGIRKELLIDCSHDNSHKNYLKQREVLHAILDQIGDGNPHVVGAMLESHINAGNQPLSKKLRYAVSLTDACMDWDTTEALIFSVYERLGEVIFPSLIHV